MVNSYFRNEPESVLRYRYCSFKARHSEGVTKAKWEAQARQAREQAISEKLQKKAATQEINFLPARHIDELSFPQMYDRADLNLRVLSKKTLPEINQAINYWENHLKQIELSSLAKSVLHFQLRKLRTVRATMREHITI